MFTKTFRIFEENNETKQSTVHCVCFLLFHSLCSSTEFFRSFFGKKDVERRPPVSVENTERVKSPSSDSEETSPIISRTKKSKKRLLSVDEDEKIASPKQMKIVENLPIEQKSVVELLSYNPGKKDYDPVNDACWKLSESVPYSALSSTLLLIEETSARLEIIRILSNFFRSVFCLSSKDLIHCVYLCVNKVAPDYDGIELGIGETIIIKAIADSTGRTTEQLKLDYKSRGDLGLVAEASRATQRTMFKPKALTVEHVYKKLKEIAQLTGNKSQQRKSDLIKSLLVCCQSHESRYLVRSLIGKLRIGLAEQSMLVALAHAAIRREDSLSASKEQLDQGTLTVKDAFCQCPSYDVLVDVLVHRGGVKDLRELCKATPGIPMKPMLAHPSKGIDEVLKRCGQSEFACEYKYDGERAQVKHSFHLFPSFTFSLKIHLTEKGEIHIYSRNSENNTSKYPDVIERIHRAFHPDVKSLILDGECVAYDLEQKKLLPFQTLSTRKRKVKDRSRRISGRNEFSVSFRTPTSKKSKFKVCFADRWRWRDLCFSLYLRFRSVVFEWSIVDRRTVS